MQKFDIMTCRCSIMVNTEKWVIPILIDITVVNTNTLVSVTAKYPS